MKPYKPLPKNPLVQRMEDMHIPGMKPKKQPDEVTGRFTYSIEKDSVVVKIDVPPAPYRNDKVIWEGREWLRSVNDPHHGRHVFMVLVLIVALIIEVVVL